MIKQRLAVSTVLGCTLLFAACGVGVVDSTGGLASDTPAITPSPFFDGDPANSAVFGVDVSHWEGVIAQREMDCFWQSGVRHVIAGTQVEEVTRQQLAMAVSRGMTVDAYVYLYWDGDMVEQVREAFRRARDFPIGRMWLDVEEDPRGLGSDALIALVRQALEACQREGGGAVCGIYTGPGFWKTYMSNTANFADVPLWYAWYNQRLSLSAWSIERFGGWLAPQGKQYAEQALCGVGVDKNVIRVSAKPTVVVDRSLPPDEGRPPAAPAGLYPADGQVVGVETVKLMTATMPRADRYELALGYFTGSVWRDYFTWRVVDPFRKTYPKVRDAIYRFRARAHNDHGWGEWSAWQVFDYGTPSGARPPDAPAPSSPAPSTPPPPPPPPPPSPAPSAPAPAPPAPSGSDVPTNLAPAGVTLSAPSVRMSFDAVAAAQRYEIAVEVLSASKGKFAAYVTYRVTTPSKLFYPQVHNTSYRFRVRADLGSGYGDWSSWAEFAYQ